MDWSKSKNILIIALLITNVLLLCFYVAGQLRQGAEDDQIMEETLALLEARNIYLETEVPQVQERMAVLNVEYHQVDEERLEAALESQRALPAGEQTEEAILDACNAFADSLGLLTETTELESVVEEGDAVVVRYRNVYEGIPVEESYMVCTFRNGRVEELERQWLLPTGTGKNKREVLSAWAALIDFMSGTEGEEPIRVEGMELVYWLDPSTVSADSPVSDTAFPAWKIIYNGGLSDHVTAYRQ
ncbi:MAG: two-component system regulatory protein YycI [Bacillota bacterium]|nr:two-component system regulatory protein YycI [Bacillota bacterium]